MPGSTTSRRSVGLTTRQGNQTAARRHGVQVPGGTVTGPRTAQGSEVLGPARPGPLNTLKARILEGVAAGHSTADLAIHLFLSKQGVDYHISDMLRKFEVPNRTALVAKAYAQGLFAPGQWPPRVLPACVAP
ncbi:LuxR C-terminal-related transcriptional regulator [Streptomyces cellostaticus]|nr:LuxR C-terminal-related transcriptional regulator [Streptomyces cellostaticus]